MQKMIWLILIAVIGLIFGFILENAGDASNLQIEDEEFRLEEELDAQDVLDILYLEEEEE